MNAILFTDGGSRGNPGPAALGYSLQLQNDTCIEKGKYLGTLTNNQAEYQALLAGLQAAKAAHVTSLKCYLDSELIVKQLNGEYRVKNASLRELYDQAQNLAGSFDDISFHHVLRHKNKRADQLVNEALDKRR